MLRANGTWDVRCPAELARWRAAHRREPYYWKVNRATARLIVAWLAAAYGVPTPTVDEVNPVTARGLRFNGWYHPARGGVISMWPRAHLKTVFHEFYHHLDHATGGRYDSSDHPRHRLTPATERTGPISLAWQFADRLFTKLTREES